MLKSPLTYVLKENGTLFDLSDAIEEDANVIKAVNDGKYIKIEAWQYEAMVDWLKNGEDAWRILAYLSPENTTLNNEYPRALRKIPKLHQQSGTS